MEISRKDLVLHPHLLDALFAFKSKVSAVFRDILGLYEINHLSLTRINKNNELLIFSSTPAMEFNLFNSALWRYDQTYDPKWFNLCSQAYWQTLYNPSRFDELYYVKQIKHDFPIGLSLAARVNNESYIYSLASHKSCSHSQELFSTQQENFYKIGQYCSNQLIPLFSYCDTWALENLIIQAKHETSK